MSLLVAIRRWPALLVIPLAVGCTRVSDRSRFEGPQEQLEILDSTPLPGAMSVEPNVRVDLCISGRLDPRSVGELDATVSSGGAVTDSEVTVQLVPWLAPGLEERPADLGQPWCEGSVLSVRPRVLLPEGARYRLRLVPNALGWAGESLATEGPLWVDNDAGDPRYVLEFSVAADPPPDPPAPPDGDPEPPPLTLRDLFSRQGPFDPSRPACSCHRDPEHLALARLDLRDPVIAYEGLLGSARARDTGFPLVSPREPSESFLIQKLLRTAEGEALHGVLGDPMPPDEPLSYADIVGIAEWIHRGALP